MPPSKYLWALTVEDRAKLEQRLASRQSSRCFICDDPLDLVLQKGQLDVDHIDPLAEDGLDAENNFALTHQSCNRSKGAANLQVARRIKEFERLQEQAQKEGKRGANLGDVLAQHGGATAPLRILVDGQSAKFSLPAAGDNALQAVSIHLDRLSGMNSFFATFPLEYLHHDDRINPRSIGSNIRGLIEEFLQKRPQLHVALAWWAPDAEGVGRYTNVLLQANTNAGGKLRQVAFDAAVMRHLGSSLYVERVKKYQSMRGLQEGDYSCSEQDLVRFFRGEHREMERYVIDAQRDAITHAQDNKLLEFVEWAGKSLVKPLSYSTIEKTFFKELLCKKALDTPIEFRMEEGTNPRLLEREQLIRLMSLFADVFFVGRWDPEIGGRRLEHSVQSGEKIPESHLLAWRIAREEVMANVLRWVRLVVANYNAYTGQVVKEDRLFQVKLTDALWERIRNFLVSLSKLPCWIDKNLANTVFGPKQNADYWEKVFQTGKSPSNIQILAAGLDLNEMIATKLPSSGKNL